MFEHSRLQAAAAQRKLTALRDAITQWSESHPGNYGVDHRVVPREGNGLSITLTARVVEEPPLDEWSLAVGDLLGALRSALDYSIRELAILGSGITPPPGERKLQFPILDFEHAYLNSAAVQLRGVSESAQSYIESIQPFRQTLDHKEIYWLWAFRELQNEAKHRSLISLYGSLGTTKLHFSGTIMPENIEAKYLGKSLKHGDVLAVVNLGPGGPNPSGLTLGASLETSLVFEYTSPGVGGPVAGQDVIQTLGIFIAGVQSLLIGLEDAATVTQLH